MRTYGITFLVGKEQDVTIRFVIDAESLDKASSFATSRVAKLLRRPDDAELTEVSMLEQDCARCAEEDAREQGE